MLTPFTAPETSLGDLGPEGAASLVSAAADIALVVDTQGVVVDLTIGSEELGPALEGCRQWIGQAWTEVVTVESRSKVEEMLHEAAGDRPPRWRQVNHSSSQGIDIPILYATIRIDDRDRFIALGRSLGPIAAIQQRLVEAQQSLERDYWRLRHCEMRYRLLFQMASEAVLIVDAQTLRVLEANPSAGKLLGGGRGIVGQPLPEAFDAEGRRALDGMIERVRAEGRAEDVPARLTGGNRDFLISAFLFREENASLLLVRLSPLRAEPVAEPGPAAASKLLEAANAAPDGVVVTDAQGRVIAANAAFLDLAQLATEDQARGESLDRWLGRPTADLNVLLANLRQYGRVGLFATTLRGEFGSSSNVEISAVSLPEGAQPSFGFVIRNVDRRLTREGPAGSELPRSVEQLTELVGRVSLKEIVRETTEVIERLCIEAALELTNDNRASAAELLGLSRQSLYVKLHRYSLGELTPESDK